MTLTVDGILSTWTRKVSILSFFRSFQSFNLYTSHETLILGEGMVIYEIIGDTRCGTIGWTCVYGVSQRSYCGHDACWSQNLAFNQWLVV